MKLAYEFHPENGNSQHVVVLTRMCGARLWFAQPTKECAMDKLARLAARSNNIGNGYGR